MKRTFSEQDQAQAPWRRSGDGAGNGSHQPLRNSHLEGSQPTLQEALPAAPLDAPCRSPNVALRRELRHFLIRCCSDGLAGSTIRAWAASFKGPEQHERLHQKSASLTADRRILQGNPLTSGPSPRPSCDGATAGAVLRSPPRRPQPGGLPIDFLGSP